MLQVFFLSSIMFQNVVLKCQEDETSMSRSQFVFRRFRPRLSGHKYHFLGRFPHVSMFDKTVVMKMDSIE